ncbi:YciI family protein [Actinokineospora iranica]|uniref:Uncharacterized conserved protein n=1 Tax=Actinokineospora iranica TaxID=1271860 RepID=A0A1G6S008_9PSEU|nr:YciI family protein [Actinokineospora iranica]SDD10250.1 Uncharacterized conserved protein [Actinokineospora iranica]
MTRYLLSFYQPDGPPPPPEVIEPIMADCRVVMDDLKAKGEWVFDSGLHDPDTATVVRVKDGDLLMTDGPFTEGKEHIGGFVIIESADLDAALDWAARLAGASTLPIEVRPMQGG